MLEYFLGFCVGVLLTELIHANYRNPPEDISIPDSSESVVGDILAANEEAGKRYWKKNIPSDVQQVKKRTFGDG